MRKPKKSTVFLIFLLFLATGIYLALHFTFGIFSPYNHFTAKKEINTGKITIIEIGELPPNFEQKQALAKIYGFDLIAAGCEASTSSLNGTKYHNQVMIARLEQKYGAGWWGRFQLRLDSIDGVTRVLTP